MRRRFLAVLMLLPMAVMAEPADIALFDIAADSDLIMTATLTNIQKQVGMVATGFRGQLVPATVLHGAVPGGPVWLVWSRFTPPMEVSDSFDFTTLEGQARLWLLKLKPDGTCAADYYRRVLPLDMMKEVAALIEQHVKTDPRTHAPDVRAQQDEARRLLESARAISLQCSGAARSDSTRKPGEALADEVRGRLRALGEVVVPTLAASLGDPDVRMRRNAALMLIDLAGGYGDTRKVNIRKAFDALIRATKDGDADVRAWAAHALAEAGPAAKNAVPALMRLVKDPEEGPRNTACMALGQIGDAAEVAVPVLEEALSDKSQDVRRFARRAIDAIRKASAERATDAAEKK